MVRTGACAGRWHPPHGKSSAACHRGKRVRCALYWTLVFAGHGWGQRPVVHHRHARCGIFCTSNGSRCTRGPGSCKNHVAPARCFSSFQSGRTSPPAFLFLLPFVFGLLFGSKIISTVEMRKDVVHRGLTIEKGVEIEIISEDDFLRNV